VVLFKSLMPQSPAGHYEHDTMYLLEKTARALLEPGPVDRRWRVDSLVEQFHINIAANERETMFSWGLGVELYNILAERRAVPSLRILESLNIPYRDDNRFVWTMDDYDWSDSNAYSRTISGRSAAMSG
jgi:nitric oxide reductase NorD protein